MTTETKSPEAMLAQMQWLPCASCGGSKDEIGPGDGSPEEPYFHYGSCPSCQDAEGTATGLLIPGLSEWHAYHRDKPVSCVSCKDHGGRIPRRHDVLEAVLEAIPQVSTDVTLTISRDYSTWRLELNETDSVEQMLPTIREAAIDALYEALVAKGLVENE